MTTGRPNGKESLLGAALSSSGGNGGGGGRKGAAVGAANAMDFGFWRDEHLDGGGWLDAPLCALTLRIPATHSPYTCNMLCRHQTHRQWLPSMLGILRGN